MVRHEPTLGQTVQDHHGHGQDDAPFVYRRISRPQSAEMAMDDQPGDYDDYGYPDAPRGIVDRVLAAPGRLAMCVVAVIGFAVVGVNAAYMQPGAHPSPLLSTRDGAPALALPYNDSQLGQRAITTAPAPIVPPSRAYDATASIAQPGQHSATSSIGGVRQRYAAPAPTPRPSFGASSQVAATPIVPAEPAARPVQTIAVNDPIGALLAPVIQQTATTSTPTPLSTAGQPAAATRSAQPLVAAVQSVLADLGYNPGSVDGVVGPSTEEAIRRFQLRRALEPNGQITTDLLREIERVTGTRITAS